MHPTFEPTADYRSKAPPLDVQPERIRVALVAGVGPHATTELQRLLRKRLRIIGLVIAALPGLGAVMTLVAVLRGRHDEVAWFFWQFSLAVPPAVVAGILWSKRPFSLLKLRGMELIVFGVPAAILLFIEFDWMRGLQLASESDIGLYAMARAMTWGYLLIGYGIFIPNTWRRCAAVLVVLALLPLATSALGGLWNEAVSGQTLRYLGEMSVWLALSTAIAVFGSGKISRLQQEAFEARKLGQYRLKERLGQGGMGEVYLAEHVLLRRPCALKVIRTERVGDLNTLRRFEREVRATATLTHPNTVQVFDYGHTEDGTFYYVMEYLPGLTLE